MTGAGTSRTVTLDALRGLGALLVLVSHVGFWSGATREGVVGGLMARGDVGVALFFALSAFLLGRPLLARILDLTPREWSVSRYVTHRVARILPAYYLALAAVIVAAVVIGGSASAPLDLATVLTHLVVGQGWTGQTFQSFTQTWSLTTEVTFYLLLPLVLLPLGVAMRPVSPRRRGQVLLAGFAVLAAVGLLAQAVAVAVGPGRWAGVLASSALGHGAWFAVGLATALLRLDPALVPRRLRPAAATIMASPGTAAATAALVLVVASTGLAGPRDLAPPTVLEAVLKESVYALFAGLLLAAALGRGVDDALTRSRLGGVARVLGDLSYGIFLWHVLVIQVVFAVLGLPLFQTSGGWLLVLVLVLTLLLATLSWRLVERPVLSWARRGEGLAHHRAPLQDPSPTSR